MNSNSASLPSTLASGHSTPHSDDEVLVRVDGVSKKFCRSLKKSLWYGVCDIAGELLPGRKRQRVAGSDLLVASEEGRVVGKELRVTSENQSASGPATSYPPLVTSPTGEASLRDGEFWAVKDVSFELRRGECLGLIGHNGAGKTTLLKMLNGLIKPDRGTITMRGRVGALIALGAGFNPILTGRENIYINGSVLGLTKKEPERRGCAEEGCRRRARRASRVGRTANQIDQKIDEIIDFAEIREFIDTPVQSYSSGMTVRLGFAVATKLAFGFLVVNEVVLA
jgi:lipopolysaccharide transport system ATP-binding protein